MVQNLRAHYRQSALGYLWLLLTPAATAVVWIFLRSARIVSFGETRVPYPLYVMSGVFLWQGFLRMLNVPLQQLNASRHFLTKIRFAWEALLLAGWGEGALEFLVYLVVLGGGFALFGVSFLGPVLRALPAMAALLLLGAAIGILLTPLGLLYGDVSRAVGLATFLLFFLTPIVYPPPTTMPGVLTVVANPVALLLVTSREVMTSGVVSHPVLAMAFAGGAVILLLAGWLVFRLAVPHLVSRL
jgi:lipopolysaccharide transport system permease protein